MAISPVSQEAPNIVGRDPQLFGALAASMEAFGHNKNRSYCEVNVSSGGLVRRNRRYFDEVLRNISREAAILDEFLRRYFTYF